MAGFRFHPEARVELDEIWQFIRRDRLDAADRVVEEILRAARGLARFPLRGFRRPDLTRRPVRFLVIRGYLVAYAPESRPVTILAVLDARRNPKVLARILADRQPVR